MENYIGHYVSVIKSDDGTRVEGFLEDVNLENTRILIKNARNFGSEGRRKRNPQIPSSDSIITRIGLNAKKIQKLEVTILDDEERDFPPSLSKRVSDKKIVIPIPFTLPPQSLFTTTPPFPASHQTQGDFNSEAMKQYKMWAPSPPQSEEQAMPTNNPYGPIRRP